MSRHSFPCAGFGSFLLLFAVLLAGCGRSSPLGEQAEVSGTVLYKGKPLPGGRITFFTARGFNVITVIDPQGHYQCQVPIGEVQISVDNHVLLQQKTPSRPMLVPKGAPTAEAEPIRGTYVPLPEKYRAPESSGLKYVVAKGTQTHDVPLE